MEKFSHALSSKPEAVRRQEPEGDPLGDLGELLREAGNNWSSFWGYRHWQQPFEGLQLPCEL